MATWLTVAICEMHWREEEPGREPVRLRLRDDEPTEQCYRCKCPLSLNVIYVRRSL